MEIVKVEVTRDKRKEYRWTAKAANGASVGTSGEGFKNLKYAIRNAHAEHPSAVVHVHYQAYLNRKVPEVVDYEVAFAEGE